MSAGRENPKAQAVRDILRRIEDRCGERFLPVLLMLVRDGLYSLRAYLGDSNETDITWDRPTVELHWPVA